ncbi:hypothetical protein Acr_00g0016870 [Actinidia rufa]|uniref:Uncharacterized protein n=1 Tax=Actinidia rufa TaxID=165716 RepID=A0A7J0DBL4_9ERIC|nr:hypothetical protein Acr_00g0016870 [Actinidia rufa]
MVRTQSVAKDLEGQVAKLEVAELRKKEALAKESAIKEYKFSNDFSEAVKKVAFTYFGEGFNLCKKQIGILHPNLNIQDFQIDPKLVKEKDELVNNPPPK